MPDIQSIANPLGLSRPKHETLSKSILEEEASKDEEALTQLDM